MRWSDFRAPWAPRRLGLPLLLAVAVACAGCKPSGKVQTAEVSGKVLFKGKGLPGGRINFIADEGGYASGANIDEDGNYKITSAPVGAVHITVDNRMLEASRAAGGKPMLKRPDADAPDPVKGRYVDIPHKYYTADKTTLTYTVNAGPQSHDVTLE